MKAPLIAIVILLIDLASSLRSHGQPADGALPNTDPAFLPEAKEVILQIMSESGPGKLIVKFAPGKAPTAPWQPDWEALKGPFKSTGNPWEFAAPLDLNTKTLQEWDHHIETSGLTWPDRFGNPVPYQISDIIPSNKTFPWSIQLSVATRILQKPLGYTIDPLKSLMVIDPTVVNDPGRTWDPAPRTTPLETAPDPVGTPTGVWTFHHLVSCLANQTETGVSPSALVRQWLDTWASPQQPESPHGSVAAPRLHHNHPDLIKNWPGLGGAGQAGAAKQLDTTKAPFRLLAIVNRFDLRGTSAFGSGGTLAELRFVFGLVNTKGDGIGDARDFLVIFEFGVPLANFREAHQYARQWAALSRPGLTTANYLGELAILTEKIVRPVAGSPRPNRSNLNQVRTSELHFGEKDWEFREFHLEGSTHHLRTSTVAQTPDRWVTGHPIGLRQWIQAHAQQVKDGTYDLPGIMEVRESANGPVLSQRKLRGAMAQSGTANTNWVSVGGATCDHDARMAFVRNTCNGCHMNKQPEGTPAFDFRAHVSNRAYSDASILSPFLHDPAGTNDDLRQRTDKLRSAAQTSPILPLDEFFFRKILQVH